MSRFLLGVFVGFAFTFAGLGIRFIDPACALLFIPAVLATGGMIATHWEDDVK